MTWTCSRSTRGRVNFLVPVRKPHVMTHLIAALRAAGDRDVVAMTVRLVGVDVPDDPTVRPRATEDERRLLSAVIAAAEREGRAVRLMIGVGHTHWIPVAARIAAAGVRSSRLVGAVRRDARGRHGSGDLLQRGDRDSAR